MNRQNEIRLRAWRERYAQQVGLRPLITRHSSQIARGLVFPVQPDGSGYLTMKAKD